MLKKLVDYFRENGATIPLLGGRVGAAVGKAFTGLTWTRRW